MFNHSNRQDDLVLHTARSTLQCSPEQLLVLRPERLIQLSNGNDADWQHLAPVSHCDLQNSAISSESLSRLFQQTKTIKTLNLQNCFNVQKPLDCDLLPNRVEVLKLGWVEHQNCYGFSKSVRGYIAPGFNKDDINVFIQKSASHLKELVLTCIDASHIQLPELPCLERLNLSRCINLNDSTLSAFNLENLRELDLSLSNISAANLNVWLQKAGKLEKLDLVM